MEELIKAKQYLLSQGYNLNVPIKPFKVAELMAEYKQSTDSKSSGDFRDDDNRESQQDYFGNN